MSGPPHLLSQTHTHFSKLKLTLYVFHTFQVETLKGALNKAKDDAQSAVESEKQHTDDLIQREERLLNTLMKQLNKAQNDQLQLDEYADEIDKVRSFFFCIPSFPSSTSSSFLRWKYI